MPTAFTTQTASVTGEKLFLEPRLVGRSDVDPQRLRAKLGYEVILLAINDYPLTLVLNASHAGQVRDDLAQHRARLGVQELADVRGCASALGSPERRTAQQVNHRG